MGSILISEYSSGNSQSLISLEGSNFTANGHIFLSDVPENITLTPSLYTGKSTSSVGLVPPEIVDQMYEENFQENYITRGYVRPEILAIGANEKTPPGIVDKFGWCTWDAFNLKEEGMNATVAGEQMPCGLLKLQENYKFRDYFSPKILAIGSKEKGMGVFIKDLKKDLTSVDSVYVWHEFCGYWGGLRPNDPGLPPAQVVKPVLSPGLEMTMKDLAVDKILSTGVGLVPPEIVDQMYEGLHSHLEKDGIDGVKVDVIQLLEMVCENDGDFIKDLKEKFTGVEIVLVNKKLTKTDIASCMAYPTGNLRAIQMLRGRNAINFNARDPTGRVWKFKLCTRNHGRYKKPVVRGDWLKYVRAKGLTVNDFIILTMVEDANGVSYNIRVEPSLKLAI